jgi:3-hydroxybutyryl-CoA dehydrogenase
MSAPSLQGAPVLVVGAGIMGAGIAQVAAMAGHAVMLHDAREGAAAQAKGKLAATLDGLVGKGKLDAALAQAALSRITPISQLEEAASAALVVEAIVEDLAAKRALFAQLEGLVAESCVLATNTSSISVTAIAGGLRLPGRVVGMHFFNPVPLMKLVEVVSGLQTDAAVAQAIFELSKAWGKVPVHARSTPGFIVNRIARPYYAEAWLLLQEQAATPEVLDACHRGAGFRMGPCELMDLIGHDTNFAVTNSVYAANFYDKRYLPSLLQREMVDGGLLGRKSGRGFYAHPEGAPALPPPPPKLTVAPAQVTVHGSGLIADALAQAVAQTAARHAPKHTCVLARLRDSDWTGLEIDGARLVMSDGRTAGEIAAQLRRRDVAVFDRLFSVPPAPGTALAFAVADEAWRDRAAGWLTELGFTPLHVADTPGLVAARTVAMLINEAADAVQQGVCSVAGADAAMKLGVNHPQGPFEFLAAWTARDVVQLLDALDHLYRGERYRASPWLRRRAL